MTLLDNIELVILPYFLVVNVVYLILSMGAIQAIFKQKNEIEADNLNILLDDLELPLVTIIVPAYNEEPSIAFCIHTLLHLSYKNKEVIVVNDGSTDETFKVMDQHFKLIKTPILHEMTIPTQQVLGCYKSSLYSNLIVINKKNGKKADALNAGINASQGELALFIDADTLIDDKELNRMIRHLITHPELKAAGSSVRVVNDCIVHLKGITKVRFPQGWLAGIQTIEYLRAFLIGRAGWDISGGSLIISGAFTFIHLEQARKIGGYDPAMLGEDMELIIRYKREQIKQGGSAYTGFIAQPVAWTEVPEKYSTLAKQRARWQIGLIQALYKHKKLFFNPSYGSLGLFVFPFFVFCEMLSPFVELLGYLIIISSFFLEINATSFTLLFLGFSWGITTLINLYVIALEMLAFHKYSTQDMMRMVIFAFLENLGYRQMNMWWRIKGTVRFLLGDRKWDVVSKTGFSQSQKTQ